jgi:hypothetical protein
MPRLTEAQLQETLVRNAITIRAIIDVMAEHSDKALHGGIDYDWQREVLDSSIDRLSRIVGVSTPEERK